MQTLVSTDAFASGDRFSLWREAINDNVTPVDLVRDEGGPFDATLRLGHVGSMPVIHLASSANTTIVTKETVRRHRWPGALKLSILTSGQISGCQDDRSFRQSPGDIVLVDAKPAIQRIEHDAEVLVLYMDRANIERLLGPVALYAATTVNGAMPAAALARAFCLELARVHEDLGPDAAVRMTSVATDLVVASIAERMSQDTPVSIQDVVFVQRAKAFIDLNLQDIRLDPVRVAAAAGVSLRRLQQLFRDQGDSITDWIWDRRLERSARMLAASAQAHLSVGAVSRACGFASQAHFSRRFKDRYDLSPMDYRRMRQVESI